MRGPATCFFLEYLRSISNMFCTGSVKREMLTSVARSHLEPTWNPPLAPSSKCWRRKGKYHHPPHIGSPGLVAQAKHTYTKQLKPGNYEALLLVVYAPLYGSQAFCPLTQFAVRLRTIWDATSSSFFSGNSTWVVKLPTLDFEDHNNTRAHLRYIFRNKTHDQLQLFPTIRNREFLHS